MFPTIKTLAAVLAALTCSSAFAEITTVSFVEDGLDEACASLVTSGTGDDGQFTYSSTLEDPASCERAVLKKKNLKSALYLGYYFWGMSDYRHAVQIWEVTPIKTCGARLALGNAYFSGIGAIKNFKEAALNYESASFGGCSMPSARNSLGVMYEYGYGVKQDLIHAYALYLLAQADGQPIAKNNVNRLERQMPAALVEIGQQRAKTLSKK